MPKIIQKLNNLKNPESILQIDTIKGFKYIDKAGEIVNHYHVNNSIPRFRMGLDGLIIDNPREKIDVLKVTSNLIWTKFSEVDSLDMVIDLFVKEIEQILPVLNVQNIRRIGWRNYFVHEFKDQEAQDKYFSSLSKIKDGKLAFVRSEIQWGEDVKANLRIQKVIKNDKEKTPGVLFDLDMFQVGEIRSEEISKKLKYFRSYLADQGDFLNVVNNTFDS